jgi:hypothetical protein
LEKLIFEVIEAVKESARGNAGMIEKLKTVVYAYITGLRVRRL